MRVHRAIENSLHRARRVTLDKTRARNRDKTGPEDLAIPRKRALSRRGTARSNLAVSRRPARPGSPDGLAGSNIGQMQSHWAIAARPLAAPARPP
jgi:hypothetical protein